MSALQALLIAGLVLVAVVHTMSRVAGAAGGVLWSAAALAWGLWELHVRAAPLVFVGIEAPWWVFATVVFAIGLYQLSVVVRAFRPSSAPPPDAS